jgi:YspA, cpYpsA-related SLOG family
MSARVLVTGSRTLRESDYETVRAAIAKAAADLGPGVVVVHGNALGADRLADRAARALGLRTEPHSARWRTEGKAAGPLRNQRMVDLGADVCIAFLAVGRENAGTKDCMRRAEATGIPVRVYEIGGAS